MEKIILALDSVKKWAVKIFGRKDYNEKGEAVTRERLVNRKSGTESAETLLLNYEERAKAYDAENETINAAKKKAEEWVAVPGTSEHQLGIAVDINADGINSYGDEVYEWLLANSYKYGFIKRYPEDKTNITGIINEPWHYRYVGEKAAEEMVKNNLCLEEYLGELG